MWIFCFPKNFQVPDEKILCSFSSFRPPEGALPHNALQGGQICSISIHVKFIIAIILSKVRERLRANRVNVYGVDQFMREILQQLNIPHKGSWLLALGGWVSTRNCDLVKGNCVPSRP